MNISSLLTVVALALAVYSLLNPTKRLQLSLKVGLFQKMVLVLGCLTIHFLVLGEHLPHSAAPKGYPVGLPPGVLAYLILLLTSLIVIWRFNSFQLSRSSIIRFRELVTSLFHSRDHAELVHLFNEHIDPLLALAKGEYSPESFRRFLPPDDQFFDQRRFEEELSHLPAWPRYFVKTMQSPLTKWGITHSSFRNWSNAKSAAEDILHQALSNRDFAHELARTHPYLALQFIPARGFHLSRFLDNYFQALLGDQSSVFFLEIRNNQNSSGGTHRYDIPRENRLLFHLLKDARLAHELGIYKPIGEHIIRHINHLRSIPRQDPLNGPLGRYHEEGKWECPVFVGIQFFDVMLTESIHQNIEWHMWLYYYPHIARHICRNLDFSHPDLDMQLEAPTRYLYLLSEMTDNLRRWVECVEGIPFSQSNSVLKNTRPSHENGNPFKSSILALAQMMRQIVETAGMPHNFIRSQFDAAFNLYFNLLQITGRSNYAETLMNVLVDGVEYSGNNSPIFLGNAIQTYCRHDHVKHMSQDIDAPLAQLVNAFATKFGYDELSQYVNVVRTGSNVIVSTPQGYRFEFPSISP